MDSELNCTQLLFTFYRLRFIIIIIIIIIVKLSFWSCLLLLWPFHNNCVAL